VVILSSKGTVRNLIAAVMTAIFSVTLIDAIFNLHNMINPGVSYIYNALGTQIAPNMVTVVIFDFRAYDTLGESIILLTAGIVVLLIFGRGLLGDKQ
jgi:energy-converting hydrogenase B subunit H